MRHGPSLCRYRSHDAKTDVGAAISKALKAAGFRFVTGEEIYFRISAMWTKIFAISFGMGVVSLLTVQNTLGVRRVERVPADLISEQIAAVFEDAPLCAAT